MQPIQDKLQIIPSPDVVTGFLHDLFSGSPSTRIVISVVIIATGIVVYFSRSETKIVLDLIRTAWDEKVRRHGKK